MHNCYMHVLYAVFILALSLNIHKNGCGVSVFGCLWVAAAWPHVQ